MARDKTIKEMRIVSKDIKRKITRDDNPYIDEPLMNLTYDELRYLFDLCNKLMNDKIDDHVAYLIKWQKVK